MWICLLVAAANFFASPLAYAAQLKSPYPISNNAVALVEIKGAPWVCSFGGLKSGKTYRHVSADAFAVNLKTGEQRKLPPLPDSLGRLAGTAVAVKNKVYIFGGYSVAKSGAEISTPDVFVFDPSSEQYGKADPMPTPVDDAVSFSYRDRYIYLVSGWHNDRNLSVVQIFDTHTSTWLRAIAYPGTPVFGHAGGIVDRAFVVFGGVKSELQANGRNKYSASDEAWWGEIDEKNPLKVSWTRLHAPPVDTAYRIAAVGSSRVSAVVFAGGTDNPYNYNGVGYNKARSKPSPELFSFDMAKGQWHIMVPRAKGMMDHRGLIEWNGRFYTIGGMDRRQRVTSDIASFEHD